MDRGSFGVEICVILFLFKLSDPKCIYMNRGNHECTRLNQKYAFEVAFSDSILYIDNYCSLFAPRNVGRGQDKI